MLLKKEIKILIRKKDLKEIRKRENERCCIMYILYYVKKILFILAVNT